MFLYTFSSTSISKNYKQYYSNSSTKQTLSFSEAQNGNNITISLSLSLSLSLLNFPLVFFFLMENKLSLDLKISN